MTLGKAIGRRVREVRKSKGLTQEQLADAVHMYRPNVARLECGYHTPTLEILRDVAEALGVRIADLVDGIEDAA